MFVLPSGINGLPSRKNTDKTDYQTLQQEMDPRTI